MLRNRKNYAIAAGGLLLVGLAAFAYYKYSRLSPEEKQDLVNNLKERGRRLFGQFMEDQGIEYQSNRFVEGYEYMV